MGALRVLELPRLLEEEPRDLEKKLLRLEEEEDKVAHTSPPLLEETTTGVDDELKGAAGEISRLGADAHAPIIVILFYVVYRVLLSLTKSILEKKRKRAVFHKLIITFLINESLSWEQKETQISRERKRESEKNHQKKKTFSLLPFFTCPFFFKCFPLFFIETKCDIETKSPFSFS